MIAVIDYGVGNLFSLKSSLSAIGQEAVVTRDQEELDRADHILLPGVGAFGDAVEKLRSTGMDRAVLRQAAAGKPLLGIYTTSPAVIEAGLVRLGIVCRTYAICGMMDVMVGGLRGIGYSVMPMIVSLIGACGLRLLWIATLFQLSQFHTMTMLYVSYPVSWIITFSVHVLCFVWAMRRLRQQLEDPALAQAAV